MFEVIVVDLNSAWRQGLCGNQVQLEVERCSQKTNSITVACKIVFIQQFSKQMVYIEDLEFLDTTFCYFGYFCSAKKTKGFKRRHS